MKYLKKLRKMGKIKNNFILVHESLEVLFQTEFQIYEKKLKIEIQKYIFQTFQQEWVFKIMKIGQDF